MDILFDAHQLGRRQTGNETYIRGLLGAFRSRSDVTITALIEGSAASDALVSLFQRRTVPRSGLLRLASLSLIARGLRPDVLHAVYFAPFLCGRPLVLTIYDISYELFPEYFSRTERWRGKLLIRDSARRARVVITVSETSRRDLIDRYGLAEERVVTIYNGVGRRFLDSPIRGSSPSATDL